MGEFLSPFRFALSAFLTLFLASIVADGSPAAGVPSTSRALVPYVNRQCAMLFLPTPNVQTATPTHTARVLQETAFVDSRGRTIMKEVDVSPNETVPWIPIGTEVQVYSPQQITKVLNSNSEIPKAQKILLERMLETGGTRFAISPSSTTVLDHLYLTMPNFKPVLDFIRKSIALSIAAREPFHFPPIVLLGDPGVGKTHFAEEVARALQTEYEFISMNSVTAGWILSGASSQWKDSRMGKVARFIIERQNANPIFLVDEVDKASGSSQYDPIASLYQLWEPRTSRAFIDEFIEVPVNTSLISWIATANDISGVPGPIRKRAIIFNIQAPSEAQTRAVLNSIIAGALAEFPRLTFSKTVSEAVFASLKAQNPRDIRKLIDNAIRNAVADGRRELEPQDIDLSIIKDGESERRGIGFTTER